MSTQQTIQQPNPEIEIRAFGIKVILRNLRIMTKYLTMPVIIVALYFGYDYYSKAEQQAKLDVGHKKATHLINTWNPISDIADLTKDGVQFIRDNQASTLHFYVNLKIDRLSTATNVSYLWHRAKLYIINADMENDIKSVEEALADLDAAEQLLSNTEKLSLADIKYLTETHNMQQYIERTRLNAFAFGYLFSTKKADKEIYRSKINALQEKLGDCEFQQKKDNRNLRIMEVLGCDVK